MSEVGSSGRVAVVLEQRLGLPCCQVVMWLGDLGVQPWARTDVLLEGPAVVAGEVGQQGGQAGAICEVE